jgi:hypothetical protein
MGSLQARDMIEHVDLDTTLSWHLSSNHYPPVDRRWVPICKAVIEEAYGIDWEDDAEVKAFCSAPCPDPCGHMTKGKLLDGLHLWDFVDTSNEDSE